jgi:GNAT superfamily N-acetyltransferase
MPILAGDAANSMIADVARRRQAIDPLLPDPVAPAADCGAGLIVTGPSGRPAAVGACEHWEGRPGELDLAWGAARRFQLTAWTAGSDVGAALDRLLSLVRPDERASGIGAMLAARLHRDVEAAGVPVTLLHYEQTNPLSVPFWSQQGYRPLWTSWETRPAGTLR